MSLSPSESWDLLLFREGKRSLASNRLCAGLLASLSATAANRFCDQELALRALLRAGELESGVADLALSDPRFLPAAETFAQVTDLAASLLVGIARGEDCQMAKHNIATEFQSEACIRELPEARPVIADAKMMAYEWIQTPHALMKLDCASHGDDHGYPGPTDIAWDLAGAIVEWQMDDAASDYFLRQYERHSGDDARWRIREYKTAYLAFRMAYCQMGSQAMRGTCEESRLWRDYGFYRNLLEGGPAIIPGIRLNLVYESKSATPQSCPCI